MATVSDVIGGLQILAKYTGPDAHRISASHDIIFAGPDLDRGDVAEDAAGVPISDGVTSAEDLAKLVELGWHISSEADSWARFV